MQTKISFFISIHKTMAEHCICCEFEFTSFLAVQKQFCSQIISAPIRQFLFAINISATERQCRRGAHAIDIHLVHKFCG
jgi:hypothetical protein